MRAVRAGKLRKRVVIQSVTGEDLNELGQSVPRWGNDTPRWASVEPADTSGREYVQGAAIRADVTHRVELRYLAGVTPKHRVKLGSRILEILSVANVEERGRMTVLLCREVV